MDDQVDAKREALRRYMDFHGLKPGPWAIASGLSQNILYNYMNGLSESLSQKTWEKLASNRGITASQLMADLDAIKQNDPNRAKIEADAKQHDELDEQFRILFNQMTSSEKLKTIEIMGILLRPEN